MVTYTRSAPKLPIRRGFAPNPRRPLAGAPSPRAAPAEARCAQLPPTGLRPEPPASACGGPFAPRHSRRGALCAASFRRGFAPNPRRLLAGAPSPPRRSRRGALCAASFRRGFAPNPRRLLAGAPSPRAAPAEARWCAPCAGCAGASIRRGFAPSSRRPLAGPFAPRRCYRRGLGRAPRRGAGGWWLVGQFHCPCFGGDEPGRESAPFDGADSALQFLPGRRATAAAVPARATGRGRRHGAGVRQQSAGSDLASDFRHGRKRPARARRVPPPVSSIGSHGGGRLRSARGADRLRPDRRPGGRRCAAHAGVGSARCARLATRRARCCWPCRRWSSCGRWSGTGSRRGTRWSPLQRPTTRARPRRAASIATYPATSTT